MSRIVFFAAMGCALLLQPAFADTRDDVLAAMQRCRTIQDDRAWLDCNYGAQQPMRAKLGLAPAPDYQQRLVPMMMPPPMAGADLRRAPTPMPAPHRPANFLQILAGTAAPVAVSSVAAVRYDSQGAFIATLQNGQVWREVNVDTTKPHLKVGTAATIRPGALGTYNMQTDGGTKVYKVEPSR